MLQWVRWASGRLTNQLSLRHSSRSLPLNRSMKQFCTGFPGSMHRNVTPCWCDVTPNSDPTILSVVGLVV